MTDTPQDAPGLNRAPLLPGEFDGDAHFAERLRALRTEAKMTQERLAAEMVFAGFRMHQTTVAKCESGERPVTIGEAIQFAAILGEPLSAFTANAPAPDDDDWNELKRLRREVLALRRTLMADVERLGRRYQELNEAEAAERRQSRLVRGKGNR